jgi:hypothetical protein
LVAPRRQARGGTLRLAEPEDECRLGDAVAEAAKGREGGRPACPRHHALGVKIIADATKPQALYFLRVS